MLRCLLRSERGSGIVEYSILIGVVAIGAIASLTYLGDQINGVYLKASENVATTAAGGGAFKPPDGAASAEGPAAPTVSGGPADGSEGDGLDYTNPTFTITGDDSTTEFQCSRDGSVFISCAGEESMGPGLAPGLHTFEVRASSTNGTSTTTVRTWTVSGPA